MALVYLENSYLENADTYLADVPDWVAADTSVQEQALVDATALLDQQPWGGVATSVTQPLAWPRAADSFYDPVLNLQVPFDSDEIPIRLQKATAMLALHLVRYPSAISGKYDATYDSISVGPIQLSGGGPSRPPKVPSIPAEVRAMIRPLLSERGATATSWWRAN